MNERLWTEVDAYIEERLLKADPDLQRAIERGVASGLPQIQVSPAQGKLLHLLVRIHQARYVLELGTLAGYSAIWMGLALPIDGKLITLELEPRNAEVARENIRNAGLAETVEVRVGPALEALPRIAEEGLPPFDLVFIDADKAGYPEYFGWALKLARKGGVIVMDNVVRDGRVLDASTEDPGVRGIRRLYDLMNAEPRVSVTAIQTVGVKGYDGFALALINR